jgi:hypothetical protein
MARRPIPSYLGTLLGAISLAVACAHAQPAAGPNRHPDVPIDPNYPEQNCQLNFTIDCRPDQGLGLRGGPRSLRARG